MKIIENPIKLKPFTYEDMVKAFDQHAQEISIYCPHCHGDIRFHEMYISERHEQVVAYMLGLMNQVMTDTIEASISLYGRDIRTEMLVKKIEDLKKEFGKPRLKVVKGDNDGRDK